MTMTLPCDRSATKTLSHPHSLYYRLARRGGVVHGDDDCTSLFRSTATNSYVKNSSEKGSAVGQLSPNKVSEVNYSKGKENPHCSPDYPKEVKDGKMVGGIVPGKAR
jgi:hypothetical protein